MARQDTAQSGPVSDEGDNVRRRRERLGMSKGELADAAGVNRDTLAAIESGEGFRRVSLTKIERALLTAEQEAGLDAPPRSEQPQAEQPQLVTIRLPSGGGADIVVSGPVGSIDKLRETAEALLRASREAD